MRMNTRIVKEDHRRNSAHSTCSNDMRKTFPGCHQFGEMWCWATAVAAATEYYTGRSGDQCVGLECQVAGQLLNADCCPFKSSTDTCGETGATSDEILKSLKYWTGMKFKSAKGILPKATLDASLQSGNPVLLEVGRDDGPSHLVTLHGCSGSGKYWHHDPERDYGTFEKVDYDWLAGDMCFAWVACDDCPHKQRLEVCSGSENPGEYFRYYNKWWNALYVPGETVV